MARQTMEAWIPEEYGSEVITKIQQTSAVELFARREPMKTDTKHVPRSGDVDVDIIPKGSPYTEDQGNLDEVLLTVTKFGKVVRMAEEDLEDVPEDVIADRQLNWASGYAKTIDNASLAITAGIGAGVPWLSVYKQIRTADATTGYVADANYRALSNATIAASAANGGQIAYRAASALLGLVEQGDWYDEGDEVIMAHPAFKALLREALSTTGQPIFAGNAVTINGTQTDTLFGLPVKWTLGARTSATRTKAPTGNPIMVVGPRKLMILGVRSGPESVVIDGRSGASALTDETLLKMRARRGFNIGTPAAFGVLELTP
jgi:HK97 family phage major capsid protein